MGKADERIREKQAVGRYQVRGGLLGFVCGGGGRVFWVWGVFGGCGGGFLGWVGVCLVFGFLCFFLVGWGGGGCWGGGGEKNQSAVVLKRSNFKVRVQVCFTVESA